MGMLLRLTTLALAAAVVEGGPLPPSLEERLSGALWGLFIGDALAMPVHWYYGGPRQIRRDFDGALLHRYERAVHPYPESIMQLSNTGGAGRGDSEGDVIGSVILHGKKKYWQRGGQYHYHVTLAAGENTLEASLAGRLMHSMSAHGSFDAGVFRDEYIRFMTTPGSHNDTYASTCHRIFFKNWREGKDPAECPGNDGHNVDTIDGLIIPSVVLLAELGGGRPPREAARTAVSALEVTRRSKELHAYIEALAELLEAVIRGRPLPEAAQEVARERYRDDLERQVQQRQDDPIVACYIGGAFPALLHFAYKYGSAPLEEALLASANAGGENVHRGAVLGLLQGAAVGVGGIPAHLRDGLAAHEELGKEIEAFVALVKGAAQEL